MLNDRQMQNQQQNVDIGFEKHGVISEIHCPYYTDERAKYFEEKRNYGDNTERVKNRELYYKSQLVKAVIYEGTVKKIFCHHLNASLKKCGSPLKESEENKNCHIID